MVRYHEFSRIKNAGIAGWFRKLPSHGGSQFWNFDEAGFVVLREMNCALTQSVESE